MISVVLSLVLLAALLSMTALPVLRKLFRTSSVDEVTPEWLENYSPEAYLSMGSLLSGDDFAFLSRQPGFDLSLQRKLRRERIDILQMYMHRMILDFNRLHLAGRRLLATSSVDQSAALVNLIRLRLYFSLAVLRMSYSLHLCRIGLSVLPVQAVIAQLKAMAEQTNVLAAAQTA